MRRPGTTATHHDAANAPLDSPTATPADVSTRAWQAQIRLHHRHRTLAEHGKRSTVTNVAIARELTGFVWAAMTHQPLRDQETAAA